MRVEQALRILPGLEALAPLRGLLFASAVSEQGDWATTAQSLTVGKRELSSGEMRQKLSHVLDRVVAHYAMLYDAFVRAIECLERGEEAGATRCLREAAAREAESGRLPLARVWLGAALGIAKGLSTREPEIETLLVLGRLSAELGSLPEASRHFTRALGHAEAESRWSLALAACEGLGVAAMERADWDDARRWYGRGLELAERTADERLVARMLHAQGDLARRTGELQQATDRLRLAHERFEPFMDGHDMARVLTTEAMVLADLGEPLRAANAYREALAWTLRGTREAETEVFIRINFARLHVDTGSFIEAEEEMRKAEGVALESTLMRQLVQIYAMLGKLRGRQLDPAGFVFFEQAIDLARMLGRLPGVEAELYQEYAAFKYAVGEREEADACLERAQKIRADWAERLAVSGGRRATDLAGAIS